MANHLIGNRTIRRPEKRAAILASIANGATLTQAAKAAGVSPTALWQWRKDDAEFAAEFLQAFDLGTDAFVEEAQRRAFAGSDTLLIFLMKARAPHIFNRRMLDVNNETNVHVSTGGDEVVHFHLPMNFRDRAEEEIYAAPTSPVLEGEIAEGEDDEVGDASDVA